MKGKRLLSIGLMLVLVALAAGLTRAQGPGPQGSVAPQAALGTAASAPPVLSSVEGLSTSFTYQGRLTDASGNPVDGTCDFRFRLYDAASGGSQVGSTLEQTVPVTQGLFTVRLDFGAGAFTGDARWLEIAVRCPTGSGSYTALSPRQSLTPAPYALALPGLWTQQNATSPNLIGGYNGNGVNDGVVGATIGGGGASGDTNRVTDDYGTVGGGYSNTASGYVATVAGGRHNTASSKSTVGGGEGNTANGISVVGGGVGNTASDYASTVAGGWGNTTSDWYATIGGGMGNTTSGDFATIAGGGRSDPSDPATANRVTDAYGTVGGGGNNQAGDAAGTTDDATYATVGGGRGNTASGQHSTVGGGINNRASGLRSTVGGGEANNASGYRATVPGGVSNWALGDYSFAAGRRAKAYSQGCFVWGDSTDNDVTCDSNDQFIVRASGGVYLYTSSDLSTGAYLAAGSGSWAPIPSPSDRNLKENFVPVDGQEVLERLAEIPITTWNYKAQDTAIRHIGPTAQDFYAAFGLGEDDKHIGTVDADGVALAAIQRLYQLLQKKDAQIAAQQQQIADLEARVAALETRSASPVQAGLLPGAGALLAGLGLALSLPKGLIWLARRGGGGEAGQNEPCEGLI